MKLEEYIERRDRLGYSLESDEYMFLLEEAIEEHAKLTKKVEAYEQALDWEGLKMAVRGWFLADKDAKRIATCRKCEKSEGEG